MELGVGLLFNADDKLEVRDHKAGHSCLEVLNHLVSRMAHVRVFVHENLMKKDERLVERMQRKRGRKRKKDKYPKTFVWISLKNPSGELNNQVNVLASELFEIVDSGLDSAERIVGLLALLRQQKKRLLVLTLSKVQINQLTIFLMKKGREGGETSSHKIVS